MKIFWVLTLALLRPIYLVYALGCLFAPLFILYLLVYLFYPQIPPPDVVLHPVSELILGILVLYSIVVPLLVYIRKTPTDPNPFQSAFMSWFGTLRCYWNTVPGPMAHVGLPSGYLVENPRNYRLNAMDMRAILAALKPGDILLRAYDGYLDGKFIRHSSVCSKNGYRAGWFTHAAMYVGSLDAADQTHVPAHFRLNKKYFLEGPQMVLHSMAIGVHTEDILTWMRCDYMAVLRIKDQLIHSSTVESPRSPDTNIFSSDLVSDALKSQLRAGESIASEAAIQNARLSALEKIGEPYDFECIQTDKYTRFSCAEYVYYCFRAIHDALGLSPQLHAFYPFGTFRHFSIMGRSTITPDDFYQLAREHHLDIVWIDPISKREA